MKSIHLKIILLSLVIVSINIITFTIIMFENQIDLIVKYSEYQAKEQINKIDSNLKKNIIEQQKRLIPITFDDLVNKLDLSKLAGESMIFNENRDIFYNTTKIKDISDELLKDARTSISNKDLLNESFLTVVHEDSYQFYFYIPFNISSINYILMISYKMKNLGNYLNYLNRLLYVIIFIIIFIHIIYSFVLYRILILPLRYLYINSKNISEGHYEHRVKIISKDEIGQLGEAFNKMADVISEKIKSLNTEIQTRTTIEKQLRENAVTDPLTQLYNRNFFNKSLYDHMHEANRYNNPFCLVLMDIDKFKNINDRYGHNTGDEVLKTFTKIIENNIRDCDILARWGGEEFILLLPQTTLNNALLLTERLRSAVETHHFNTVNKVTSSFGVVEYAIEEKEIIFLKRVDDALYLAKSSGRNCVKSQNDFEGNSK